MCMYDHQKKLQFFFNQPKNKSLLETYLFKKNRISKYIYYTFVNYCEKEKNYKNNQNRFVFTCNNACCTYSFFFSYV